MLFLLDASTMSSATVLKKTWELQAASHHLDSCKRLVTCYKYIRSHRADAQILTLLEADGFSQLIDEWRGSQDVLICEIVPSLQCVPFGCRVTAFLLEIAAQRITKGWEVAIISNDVDIVVASRGGNNAKWQHLGFMFVDDEFLLPGLAKLSPCDEISAVASRSTKQSINRRSPHTPSPKPASMRVQKSIGKVQSGGQGRSGTARPTERWSGVSDKMTKEESKLPEGHSRKAKLETSTSTTASQPEQTPAPCATEDLDTLRKDANDAPNSALKEIACNMYMYADTQVDMAIAGADEEEDAFQDGTTTAMEESAMQATIEQDIAASTPQDIAASTPQEMSDAASDGAPTVSADGGHKDAASDAAPTMTAECAQMAGDRDKSAASEAVPMEEEPSEELPAVQTCTPVLEEDVVLNHDAMQASLMQLEATEAMGVDSEHKMISLAAADASEEGAALEVAGRDVPEMQGEGAALEVTGRDPQGGAQATVVIVEDELPLTAGDADGEGNVPEVAGQDIEEMQGADPVPHASMSTAVTTEVTTAMDKGHAIDVNELLGNWVRDGGRTHLVELNGAAGDSQVPGALEFLPSGGGCSKPIVRVEGTWALNGYTLDEARSTATVLRWQHAASGALRTWWRPGSKAPRQEC